MQTDEQLSKKISLYIVQQVCPDDLDQLEDSFELLQKNRFQLKGMSDIHGFDVAHEAIPYVISIGTLVGTIFMNATKGAIEKEISQYLRDWWFQKRKKPTETENEALISFVDQYAGKLNLSEEQKNKMKQDLINVLQSSPDSSRW